MELCHLINVPVEKDRIGRLHHHDYLEMVLVSGAGGEVWLNGKKTLFFDGDLLLHPARRSHKVTSHGDGMHFCLGMKGAGVEGVIESVIRPVPEIRAHFQEMAKELSEKRPHYRIMVEARAQETVGLVLRQLSESGNTTSEPNPAERMREILDRNFRNPTDLADLSTGFLLSKDYLRHSFKKRFGVSPIQYLISRRIDAARRLILETDRRIRQIATDCGFENEYYFSRLFKNKTGLSPESYRKKHAVKSKS